MNKVAEIKMDQAIRISRQYRRSIRIDSDIGRIEALDGYVLTDTARESLAIMSRQIVGTQDRAFTWTGPYGGGKSSLAVVLGSALSADASVRSKALELLGDEISLFRDAFKVSSKGWLVLPLVGKRASIAAEVARVLDRKLSPSKPYKPTHVVNDLVELAEGGQYDGIIIFADEMGKFLEAAATGGEDIHFFQDLAEKAGHCKGQLVIVGLLHQSFRQYASRLGIESREEWAKIQGRYGDIAFVATGDEVVQLIGNAIECSLDHPASLEAARVIANAIADRRPSVGNGMAERLDQCWPLHPVTAALLGPASRRQFGQNERSVFGFLSSLEPHAFQDFLRTWDGQSMYGPTQYWDYLRTNLEQAILASPDGHRWAQAVDAVERAEAKGASVVELALAKALALIDLFRGSSGISATNDVLCTAVQGVSNEFVATALEKLAQWRVTVYRKHLKSWSVFEGSDFDIDQAVAKVRVGFTTVDTATLSEMATLHPVVAKREYHQTGTFRWMGVSLHTLQEAEKFAEKYEAEGGEFGRFALVLPDRQAIAKDVLKSLSLFLPHNNKPVVFGVPPNYKVIGDLGAELFALQIVQETSPELEGDSVARREVAARHLVVKGALEEALREAISKAIWLHGSQAASISSLTAFASNLAEKVFDESPRVWSELVNRDVLSPNSVKARRDLMHRMVDQGHMQSLGVDGFPAERGLYETVLAETKLHGKLDDEAWGFNAPTSGDDARLLPLWEMTKKAIVDAGSTGLSAAELYSLWAVAPYGVKMGLLPIFLLAFALTHTDHIAIYRDGMFEPKLTDVDADELLQDPRRFSLRWVTKNTDHVAALESIAATLSQCGFAPNSISALGVSRNLVKLAFSLSFWAKRTQRVSPQARAVRDILLRASDPNRLVLVDLPNTLGVSASEVGATIEPLLKELLEAYPKMLHGVDQSMAVSIDALAGNDPELRERAESISKVTGDLRLQGFSARLLQRDGSLAGIESILSLAANKPPRDWTDLDIDSAIFSIADLALAFRRAETLVNVQGRALGREAFAVVIGAGGSSQVVTKTFQLAGRDKKIVQKAADTLLLKLEQMGLQGDLIFAALARAGSVLHEKEEKNG